MKLNDTALLRNRCYIDGQWTDADSHAALGVANPATGAVLGTVPALGAHETRRAIEAADAAWPAWRARSGRERASVLRKWFELISASAEDLARLMTAEQGKPFAEAKGEVTYAASFVEWFAEEAKRVYGDTIPAPTADKRLIVIK